MDSLSLFNTFLSVIGLLANFQSSREHASLEDFIEWLYENDNRNTADIIKNNIELKNQIALFMNQNHEETLKQLSNLNNLMVSIAQRIDGLSGIANNFKTEYQLSEQALRVLREFVNSEGLHIWRLPSLGGTTYAIDANQTLEISEPRFIDDDLSTMTELGLLKHDINPQGYHRYKITKLAVEYINSIK